MRILVAISLIALALACAHKDAGKGLNKSSSRNKGSEKEIALREGQDAFDSTFYVGYVDYFPETREFYTSLYYNEGHEYPDEDLLESRLDSVIILEEDWGRERLPLEEARKLLVLAGLDTLYVYNRNHQLISRSPFVRVEYLWNGLESYFIAVFQSDGNLKEQTEELYAVSAAHASLLDRTFAELEVKDPALNDRLLKELNISRLVDCDMRHYRVRPEETTYSVISTYSMDSQRSLSYLTAFNGGEVKVLNEEIDNFHFLNILPVPIALNGRPLLLISAGYPSSDVIWDYLAGWNGNRYEAIDYNRIHLRDILRRAPNPPPLPEPFTRMSFVRAGER